jgi:starch synthase
VPRNTVRSQKASAAAATPTGASPLRVLFAAAEFAPLIRVGGLAAAAAGLVAELRRQDVEVVVVLPDYTAVPLADERTVTLTVPPWAQPATARFGVHEAVGPVVLVDVPGIRRPHPYVHPDGSGWEDNDRRFLAFSAAVAALCEHVRPDVAHLNDWHTAATLAFAEPRPPAVLTIHTLGYQGVCSPAWLGDLPHHRMQFEMWGDTNPLAGAVRLAELVVAVSPNYAREITTDEGGAGLAGLLRQRGDRLVGLLNGIDDEMWNPQTDPHVTPFAVDQLADKAVNRAATLREFGLGAVRGPLFTAVTRLVDQKGVDLLVEAADYLASVDGALVVLGDGDEWLADLLTSLRDRLPDRVGFVRGYDDGLAHRLFAGADVFVMPSRFEPCGLAQMQAMRYGTLPLVTDVGGLHDTVIDIDQHPDSGTGVVVPQPTAAALVDGMHRMARAWANPQTRQAMQRRGMTHDWSWRQPAARHIEWYRTLVSDGR